MSFVDKKMMYVILAFLFGSSIIALLSYYIAKEKKIDGYSQSVSAIVYMIFFISGLAFYMLKKEQCNIKSKEIKIVLKGTIKLTMVWILLFMYLETSGRELNKYWIIGGMIVQAYINTMLIREMNEIESLSCIRSESN